MNDENDNTTTTVPPEAVDALFDDADLAADINQIRRTLDAHRRELVLMWIAVLCCASALTFMTVRDLRDA